MLKTDAIFVALLLPNGDGSGDTKLLGVFTVRWKAEAACYRDPDAKNGQPTDIIECRLDEGE